MNESLEYTRARPRRLFLKHIVRKIFSEDWVLKLVALVITLGLWLGVAGLITPTVKRFTVPLNMSVANNAEITNAAVQEVDIVISGDKRKVDQINRSELSASVDLSDVAPGDRVLQLTPENISVSPLPPGVKLDDVQPSRIAVRIEEVEERDLPVAADTVGQPAAGYEIYGTIVTPARVRVRGPASYISTLDSVPTGALDISGAKADVTARQVPISVANTKAAVFNTVVDVTVRIGEKRIERTFILSVNGKRLTAVLYGPRSLLLKMRAADLKVEIVKSDTGEDIPRLLMPETFRDNVEIRRLKIG